METADRQPEGESELGRRPLVLIGVGGYAKSVLDAMDHDAYRVAGFVDEKSAEGTHLGYPILARSLDALEDAGSYAYFIAIGNNANRKRWYDALCARGLEVVSIIDRSAIVSNSSRVGRGCFVGKLAVVNGAAIVGDDAIVNTKALVEHGCVVGDHANVSTGAILNGDVLVGEGSFVGSGSIALGQLSIGSWSTVGAGAVVTRSVADHVTVVGVPARPMGSTGSTGGKAVLG